MRCWGVAETPQGHRSCSVPPSELCAVATGCWPWLTQTPNPAALQSPSRDLVQRASGCLAEPGAGEGKE